MARACEGPFFEYGSKAQGKTFAGLATYNFIRDTPNWTPGDPLPIKEEDIIKAARAEVARHVANPDHWFYSAYDIIRFRGNGDSHWYFLVFFDNYDDPESANRHSEFQIPVNFKGIALPLYDAPPPKAEDKKDK